MASRSVVASLSYELPVRVALSASFAVLRSSYGEGDYPQRGIPVRSQEAPPLKKPGKRASPEQLEQYTKLKKEKNLLTQLVRYHATTSRKSTGYRSVTQLMCLATLVSPHRSNYLMIDYYKAVQGGHGRSDALRQTQLKMLADPKRRHPFFGRVSFSRANGANLDGKR